MCILIYDQIIEKVRGAALSCSRDPEEITVISVSKNQPLSSLQEVYRAGCRNFGESRLQEAKGKIPLLPDDCQWHFIGTLQSNKAAQVLPLFHLIHSVDTPQLAEKISLVCGRQGVSASILLQVNTSGEVTKHGLSPEEWDKHIDAINKLSHLRVEGLMTMAPFTGNEKSIHSCFRKLYELRERWKGRIKDPFLFRHLSMGMSNDYVIAIEEGATLLRIGSAIFEKEGEQRKER